MGDVDNNLNRADAVLSRANPQNLDLLVLPELAFSGEFPKRNQQSSDFAPRHVYGVVLAILDLIAYIYQN